MSSECIYCLKQIEISPQLTKERPITHVFCNECYKKLLESPSKVEFLNKISTSIIVYDNVGTIKYANDSVQKQVHKSNSDIIDTVGGELINCVYVDHVSGCGNSPNCQECVVQLFLTRTVDTGKSFSEIKGHQISKHANSLIQNDFKFSMEKLKDYVLLRVDRWIEG